MRGHRGQSPHSPILVVLLALLFAQSFQAQNGPCVIPGKGYFRIHVGTGGLLGGFAHGHLIEAQKIEGCALIDGKDLTHSSIKLNFAAAAVRVMDPDESAKDRAAVQENMEKEVLRVSEFPRIVFESTSIELVGSTNQLKVHGNLTLRDKTQPVVVPLTFKRLSDGSYQADGKYNFKQSTFGIKPIQLAVGTIKVKDEVELEFQLFLK